MDGSPRDTLRQTELDPRRKAVRRTLLCIALGVTALVTVLLFFEKHHTQFHDWHATVGEDIEHAMVVWGVGGAVCVLLALALRFGFVTGILAGIGAGVGGFAMLVAAAIVHLFSDVTHNGAGQAVLLGSILVSLLGLAIVVSEIVLRVHQRSDDRRKRAPPLPRAVVVKE